MDELSVVADLGEQGELLNAEGAGGGEGVEGEVDGGGAMGVPAAAVAAIRPGLELLRQDRDLAAVQELEEEQKDVVPDGVDGDDMGVGGRRREQPRRRVSGAKELAEEDGASGEDAAVGVDQPPLHAKRHVAKRLPVHQQVEVVQGQRPERLLKVVHGGGRWLRLG